MGDIAKLIGDWILYAILAQIWLLYFINTYLNYRQRKFMNQLVSRPPSIEGHMSKDVYDKSRSYFLDKLNFEEYDSIHSHLFQTAFLLLCGYYHFWNWSIAIAEYFGFTPENEILISGICMFLLNIGWTLISLPSVTYQKFVIEERHGFNKETPLFFIKDQFLKFVVLEAFVIPILCAIIWIMKNGGDYFFFYLWIFSNAVCFFIMFIYPEFIAPIFDKYTPLSEGELKTKIEELAASVKFPLHKLFIVEGSKRSSHSNAYLYGFYKHKRIVLFDTLLSKYHKSEGGETETKECETETKACETKSKTCEIETKACETETKVCETETKTCETETKESETETKGCETEEVLAILAHELGHWKLNHTLKMFLLTQISLLVSFFTCATLFDYKPMYIAFGFLDSQPTFIGSTIVTTYILIPFTTVMNFVTGVIQRKFEFDADKFAQNLGYGDKLASSLIKLHRDNLNYPIFDKLYSCWVHSHPPLQERLSAIKKED